MKNLTITVDEEVVRWARVLAARHDTSLSRFVGDLLRKRMEEEVGYEAAMKQYLARKPMTLKRSGTPLPKREDLYDRNRLR